MKKTIQKWWTKCIILLVLGLPSIMYAQPLSGTYTIPGSYSTIATAVAALNTNGVGSGGAVFNVSAGYTETLTASISLNATGTLANPIVFQKSGVGANPTITSFAGTQLASTNTGLDVMWSFIGSDYVTISGINLQESASNTTPTTMMEVGYGFYKASATDGTNNNTVQNCTITLNRNNSTATTAAASPRINVGGSAGIEVMACTPNAISTTTTVTSVAGASSNNKFYANTIQNCNYGIALSGFAAASPYTLADVSNDVGGNSLATGNTIINFGGGTSATAACGAVFVKDQWSFNISYNTVNNNTGSGVNHPTTNRGIFLFNSSNGASADVNYNTVTIACGSSTTANNWCLDAEMAQSGANGNTINLNNNRFLNCKLPTTNSGVFTAIWVNVAASNVNVNNNYIYGFSSVGTGVQECILSGLACGTLTINNNTIDSTTLTAASGTFYNIANTAVNTVSTNITNNTVTRTTINTTGAGTQTLYGIYNSAAVSILNFYNNTVNNFTRNGTTGGTTIGIYSAGGTTQTIRRNNVNTLSITGTGTTSTMYGIQGSGTTFVCDSNTVFGLNVAKSTATGPLYGIYNISSPTNENYNYNTIYNLTHGGTTSGLIYGIYTSTTTGVRTVSYNTIYNLTGSGLVYGLNMVSSVPRIFNNKIYDLTTNNNASSAVAGMTIGTVTAGTCLIYNNLISRLFAPVSNGGTTSTVMGINITSTSASVNFAVYNNTINLNATSSGTNFSSTCIFHTYSATATSAQLDMRNNILVNNSTPNGTGITAAFRRSVSTALTNINANTNRNLFYAGIPSANRAIYYDGTNVDQTISAYQTRVSPRDSNSVTENPNFLSNIGANSNYLRIDPSVATAIESGGRTASPVTTDYFNNSRAGNSGYTGLGGAPDLGAIEGNYTGLSINTMVFDSANADQITGQVPLNSINNRILRIRVYVQKSVNALEATSFLLNTNATSNASDLLNAKIYSSDTNSTFTNTTLFGAASSPSGQYSITGSKRLAVGINYFWLTYDISPTANGGNYLDASVDNITLSGTQYSLINGDPFGSRQLQSPLSGTYYVGVGQSTPNYTTITAALADLNALGVSAPVTFQLTDALYNVSSGETFPLTFGAYANSSSTNTVTLMPSTGVASRIESNNSTATFDLNGINNFTINGSQGGLGGFTSGSNLIISNSATTAPAIRFINEASNNRLLYTDIRSNNAISSGIAGAGVVNFGNTTGANGNDNNIVRNCDIHEETGGNPIIGISSIGSNSSLAANNDNNIIDSCNIYNYYSSTLSSAGIYIGSQNNTWQITANHLYQTSPLTYTTAVTHRAMWITPNTASLTSASGFVINNNYIGGNASNGSGMYTFTSNTSTGFWGVDLSLGVGATSTFNGNTIANINGTLANTVTNSFLGMKVANGIVTVNGNTIGSTTANSSIVYTTTVAGGGFMGLQSSSGNTVSITNNRVAGIEVIGNATTATPEFYGINLAGAPNVTCSNNIIGDTLLANSIYASSLCATSTFAQNIYGIWVSTAATSPVYNISNNIVSNMRTNYQATGSQAAKIKGIVLVPTTAGTYNVTGNAVNNLSTTTNTTSNGANSAIGGIVVSQSVGAVNVTNNTIHSLTLNGASTTAAVQNTGIFYSTATTGTNILSRNFVHSQSMSANNPFATITGMDIAAGNGLILNNMLRLGIDGSGNSIATACTMRGITKGSGSINIYFNTVLIGGTGVNTDFYRTYAFQRTGAGTDDVRNNIFINQRANSSTGAGHFAVGLNNNTLLNMNFNLLNADSIGLYNSLAYKSISNWKSASAIDASSINSSISFVNPTGSSSNLDLHIDASIATPIEAYGATVTGTGTDVDFDNQTRASFSPVDLGADAGNFISSDVAAPSIVYTALVNNEITTDRTITATITDATGVYANGTFVPRIYFKKLSAGAWNSSAGTLTSGNTINGTWTFTISAASMGGLIGADSVYYFVVAQDSTPSSNLGSFPGGTEGFDVNTINVYPTPFNYRVKPIVSGNFLVGAGQTFTTLTGSDGLFSYINSSVVSGNISIQITSDIEEPTTVGLVQTTESGSGGYTIAISPDAAVMRSLTGTTTIGSSAIIRLEGADRVTLDGSFGGSGKYIRIMNRALNGASLNLTNDADMNVISNCYIEGVNNTVAMLNFISASTGGTGNDSNLIVSCVFRDTLGTGYIAASGLNKPNTGIQSQGTAGALNDYNTIRNCEFYNVRYGALNLATTGGDYWTFYNNSIYTTNTDSSYVGLFLVLVSGGGGHIIRKNSIGGSAPDRSGAPYVWRGTGQVHAIFFSSTSTNVSTIDSNIVANIYASSTSGSFYGYRLSGNTICKNNVLGGALNPWDTIAVGNNCYGIMSGGINLIKDNLCGNIYNRVLATGIVSGIYGSSGSYSIINNTVRDIYHAYTGAFNGASGPIGIYALPAVNEIDSIDGNTVYNITSGNTGGLSAKGIQFGTSSNSNISITRNKIYNITADTRNKNAIAIGILSTLSGTNIIANNQITLGANTGERVVGIYNNNTANPQNIYNNTIYIEGTSDTSSYGIYNGGAGSINAINNLIYNKRTVSSGTGDNFAVGSLNSFSGSNLRYNMMIVNDVTKLYQVGVSSLSWSNLNALYPTTYNTNWAENVSLVNSNNLFTSTSVADLSIIPTNAEAWYSNGKGIALASITNDYIGNSRSNTIVGGPTDIGAFEVTPSSIPSSAIESATPLNSAATTYTFASRQVASINWGANGTVPSTLDVKYYTGNVAPSLHSAMKSYKAYYVCNPTGGSGYDYTITLSYDSALFGNVPSSNLARLVNYSSSSWTKLDNSIANTITGLVAGNTSLSAASLNGNFTISDTTTIPPSSVNLSLTAYLQGLYLGSGLMTASPFNADGISPTNLADTIIVELNNTATLATSYSNTATISTSGVCNTVFPAAASGNSYYIVIRHRNSIATWSANPVLMNPAGTSFNFSSAASQSFGGNLMNDGTGIFMIFTGDINQDGSVDFNDYPNLDIASSSGVLGYDSNDLNGDASVDFNDYPLIDINSSNGIISITP